MWKKEKRIKELKESYGFDCVCERCCSDSDCKQKVCKSCLSQTIEEICPICEKQKLLDEIGLELDS